MDGTEPPPAQAAHPPVHVADYSAGPPKKDRTALIVVVAVLGMLLVSAAPVIIIFGLYALIGGGFLSYMWLVQPGKAHVVCPYDRALNVQLDAEDPVSLDPGTHVALELDRGDHRVIIADSVRGQTVMHELEVGSGFFDKVVPAMPVQCFVRLDVTEYSYPLYRMKDGEGLRPIVYETYEETQPFGKPSSTYLDENDMPSSLESGSTAYLLLDLPCEKRDLSDDEILTFLGY